ncbi:family 10 glycosylhydrolase [Mycoplasmatota bacterium]|nr:family 10 glycosylhydrolase [Mycoplasmatota bacterium]
MKKLQLLFLMTILLFISCNNVYASEEEQEMLMNQYDSSKPIIFRYSEKPVFLPKEIKVVKQQFRGVYVYTNKNLDFKTENSIKAFKAQYEEILNTLEEYNMNAIIFQIRPTNDAFYQSELNPWSKYLMGTEDQDPGWDPLKWMISVTHGRGISFYAGFNAFRVSNATNLEKVFFINSLSEKNYANKHPEYVLTLTNTNGQYQYILNPGEEDVKQFVLDSIMEIVKNYDIDAINLENFFYPMSALGNFNDSKQFNNNNEDNLTVDNWRRQNITDLIINVKDEIIYYNNKYNKRIQLGVTPYGVWDNYNLDNKNGSKTTGYTSYGNEYADTRFWVKKEYVDYIAPQVKWEFEDPSTPYADVVQWWAETVKDTQVNLYISHYVNPNLKNQHQILNQLRFNQNYSEIKGSLLYSYHTINNQNNDRITKLLETIKTEYWHNITIHPVIKSVDNKPPKAVDRLLVKYIKNTVRLSWDSVKEAKLYLVYRFRNNEEMNLSDPTSIIEIVNQTSDDKIVFIDNNIRNNNIYRYVIVTIDEAYNESAPVIFDIDLNPNKMLPTEIVIFSITSLITFIVISYTAIKTLRNKN